MRSCCSSWQSRTDFTGLYITQSSANSRTVDVVCSARSLMKIRKSSGPSTDPCGTPDYTDAGPDVSPSTKYSLGSSFKKRLYPSVQVAIAFQLPEESLVGNGVKSFSKILDWRQCGNSLALFYFAVVMELPDSLWMHCKSEFGVIFLRCSPR